MRRILRPILAMIFIAAALLAVAPTAVVAPTGGQVVAGVDDVPIGGGPRL